MEAEGKEEDLHKPMNNFPSPLEMQIVPFSSQTVIFDKTIILC